MDKYYIKAFDWQKIHEILKKQTGIRVKNECKTRIFIEGVYFILKTGAQWREIPSYYGKWRSIHIGRAF